jgi:lipopolysaccharide transport system permease protein
MSETSKWDWEIHAGKRTFSLEWRELIQYRDLLFRLVKRDFLVSYQQTILGPFWIFLQPLLTTFVYYIVFSWVARIPTGGLPPVLFYLPGSIIWTFFSESLTGTMYTFLHNAQVFSKVYFPRLIVPLSVILSQFIRLSIQLLLFALVYGYYAFTHDNIKPSAWLLLLPFILLLTAGFAMGAGLLVSVFMAKYRDLDNVLQFILRLFMFMTPVVYPAAMVPGKFQFLFWLNPLTPAIELFRAALLPGVEVPVKFLLLATVVVLVLLTLGLRMFKQRELKVMDII